MWERSRAIGSVMILIYTGRAISVLKSRMLPQTHSEARCLLYLKDLRTLEKNDGKLRKGDLVHHASFGDGVIIRLEDGLATIAFEQKFGVRKIMADHPSLTKK